MSTDIQPIAAGDIDDVVALVREFVEARARHPAGVSPMSVAEYLAAGVGNPGFIGYKVVRNGVIRGVIFGVVGPDWMSGKTVAQEQIWYVQPGEGSGILLMRAFISEARRRGAAFVVCGVSSFFMGERVSRVLGSMGFSEIESWWVKGVS